MVSTRAAPAGLAEALARIVGRPNVLVDPAVTTSYTVDWTRRWHGTAALVVRPAATSDVAAVVRVCANAGVPVVPQGGNTGLVGGGVPEPRPLFAGAVLLSLRRLDHLSPVDDAAAQVTAGAGVTLARLQQHLAASSTGWGFGVDLAARDSATVGGMAATNAGGVHVVRYGGMRQQVVGVEAVLATGEVVARLDGLVKDNTGYDLTDLFVGSEGTLGVITRVRLRLVPSLSVRVTALLGLDDTAAAVAVTAQLRREVSSLEAVEIFYPDGLDLVCQHAGLGPPLPRRYGAYLLIESAGRSDGVVDELAGFVLGLGLDESATAVAIEGPARAQLWAYRERHTEVVSSLGVPHKLDVTLPLARLAAFEAAVRGRVASVAPEAIVVIWGHLGDGNLHVNVVGPPADDDTVDDAVLRLAAGMGGSISAEHGVGRAKVRWLGLTRAPAEIGAMKAIKNALDPTGLFNPGVLLP
ncbi:MAG TPA: FAD-binding oxidoreductase [Acidimicrobiales bacterium]|nr:FAD-binding oxidoreductase [Acidimicrobiales bacterium]